MYTLKNQTKKLLAILLSVLLVIGCFPVVSLAAETGTLTIGTDTTSNGIDIDDDVAFTYEVVINDAPFTGTAAGSDGNAYSIVDGSVTLPYNVSATINDIAAGSSYAVKRLGYDNEKYALVGESEVQTGKVAENTYFKKVNGEETVISADEFAAETNNGTNLAFTIYKDADGNEYTEDQVGKIGGYNSASDLTNGDYTYVLDTLDRYTVKGQFNRGAVDETSTGSGWNKKTTYTATGSYTFSCDGFDSESGNATGTAGPSYSPSKNTARTAAANDATSKFNSYIEGIYSAIDGNGKLVRYEEKGKLNGINGYAYKIFSWGGEEDYTSEEGEVVILAFTEILSDDITDYEYRVVYGEENKSASFAVTLAPAPTGTFQLNFALDDTVPAGYDKAVFEIKNANGDVLT